MSAMDVCGEKCPSSSLLWRESSQIAIDGNRLSYTGRRQVYFRHEDVGIAIGRHRFSNSRRYFEFLIENTGNEAEINIGVVHEQYSLDMFPGWEPGSAAYHADDGFLFDEVARSQNFCVNTLTKLGVCGRGDRIGCGVRFRNGPLDGMNTLDGVNGLAEGAEKTRATVFFTKNGYEVGCCEQEVPLKGLYPSIGLRSVGSLIQIDMTSFQPGKIISNIV